MWRGPTTHLLLVIGREHGPWAQPHLLSVRENHLLWLGGRQPQADPRCSKAVSPHLCTQDRGSREEADAGDSFLLPKRLWELPCMGLTSTLAHRVQSTVWMHAAKQGAGQSHPRTKGLLGLLLCPMRQGRTAESWSKGHPAFTLSPSWGRVLAELGGVARGVPSAGREGTWGGGGQGAPARGREGVWGWAEQGAGRPGSTPHSHWPPRLLVPRGGRAQRSSEQLTEKGLRPVPPPREEGEREEQAR